MKKVAIIISLVAVIGGGLLYWGAQTVFDSMTAAVEEAQIEAEQFAKNATKEACLTETGNRINACTGMSCYAKSGSFGAICMALAQGDATTFCADKPTTQAEFNEGTWQAVYCKEKSLNEIACMTLYKSVEAYCQQAKKLNQSSQ